MAQPSEIAKLERRYAENPKGRNFAPLADAYRKAGQVDQAIELCKSGLERHPDYVSAHIVYGRCLIDKHTDSAAEQVFRKVLELDPENVIAFRVLAEISQRTGRLDEAVVWLTKLLAADPMNGDAAEALTLAKSKAAQAKPPAPALVEPPVRAVDPRTREAGPPKHTEPSELMVDSLALEPEPEAPDPLVASQQPSGDFETFDGTVNFSSASHMAKADGIELQEEVMMEPTEIAVEGLARTQYEGSGMFKVDSSEPSEPAELDSPTVDLPLIMPDDVPPVEEAAPVATLVPEEPPERPGLPERPAPPSFPASSGRTSIPAAVTLSDDDGAADSAALSRAEPVVTETMAELYLKQGHRDDALRVYRALAAQRPGDTRLRAKVAMIMGDARTSGQTAQAFLRGILSSRPGQTPAPEPVGESPLDAAFAKSFLDPEPPGAPTRAAEDNISLDEIFGDDGSGSPAASAPAPPALSAHDAAAPPSAPAPAAAGGFSFDEFFGAAGAPAGSAPTAPNPPPRASGSRAKPPVEEEHDLDQFQAWLKGLKS